MVAWRRAGPGHRTVRGLPGHGARQVAEADEALQGCPADGQAAERVGQSLEQASDPQGQEDQDAELNGADPPGPHGRRARPGDPGQPGAPGEYASPPPQSDGGGDGPGAGAEHSLALGELGEGPFPGSEGGQFLGTGEGPEDPRADGGPCGRKCRRLAVGEDHRDRDARRREHPGGQDGPARRGQQEGGGDDGGTPGRRGGQDRDGGPDHEILSLLGVTDQAGQQIAPVPARQPGGKELFQAAVQPGPHSGLEAEPEVVTGEPLGVAGGAAQEREQLHGADGDREQQDRRPERGR